VNDLGLSLTDLYEAAARATINERCAPAYLHDFRGSLQALFGALELLGRSARAGGGDLRASRKPATSPGERSAATKNRRLSYWKRLPRSNPWPRRWRSGP